MQHKSFLIEELKFDDESRTVEGFASVFNNIDSYNDIVMPGAFAKTIGKRKPAMLWQHNSDEPIGIWDEVEERPKGLFVKGRILDTAMGDDAYKLVKAGAISGMSIGYSAKKWETDSEKQVRRLTEVELYEVSLVTFPANEKATITRVKSLENLPFEQLHERKQEIEAALCDAGASKSVAKYVASLIPQPAQRDVEGEDLSQLAQGMERLASSLKQLTV